MIGPLVMRNIRVWSSDKGRFVEVFLFPISFLTIWGLLLVSGIIPRDLGASLLVINMIWSLSSVFQLEANAAMNFDFWGHEFIELLRAGVRAGEYLLSALAFGFLSGIVVTAIFVPLLFWPFHVGAYALSLLELLPVFIIASLGLAALTAGIIIRLGRTYAFFAWTILQVIIMLSSPYAPLSTMPAAFRWISIASPWTHVFAFVRSPSIEQYAIALVLAFGLFALGTAIYFRFFAISRRTGELIQMSN